MPSMPLASTRIQGSILIRQWWGIKSTYSPNSDIMGFVLLATSLVLPEFLAATAVSRICRVCAQCRPFIPDRNLLEMSGLAFLA
jgi:hypothetical protein